jgi:hypothetical protein
MDNNKDSCFPDYIHSSNSINFDSIFKNILKINLRSKITEFILFRNSENDYFDIDNFISNYNTYKSTNTILKYVSEFIDEIINELGNLGWKCKLSFGDTGLFIYSSENPPTSCW